jgi:aspartate ammonia-lyase
MLKKYYGEETEKALKNFPFDVYKVHKEFISALVKVKKAAAIANCEAGNFSRGIKNAIVKACDEILAGKLKDQFPLRALQGGAGTSTNMNVNEVIASRATEILNGGKTLSLTLPQRGREVVVHPNDHVNCSMSTNDANPSAIKIASLSLIQDLTVTLEKLAAALEKKSKSFAGVVKLARTHLQDAIPTTLGAEFASYAAIIRWHGEKIKLVSGFSKTLNLGGTAIGNSVNAKPKYIKAVYRELNKITGQQFKPAANLMSQTSSQTDFLAISQAVTALCLDCSKIASDLRLLSSGPRGGFGEIQLAELQKGSSIMPGKVNPILPETVNQLYFLISGNNLSIEHSAHAAQLELGVMFPTIADRLLQSLKLTSEVLEQFTKRCVVSIKANRARCKELLEKSTAYATLLTPKLGYDAVSVLVKEFVKTNKTIREIVLEKKLMSNKELDALVKSFRP